RPPPPPTPPLFPYTTLFRSPHAILQRSQLPQMGANQRATGKIKGRIHHLLQLAARLQFPLFFSQRGQISYRDFQFQRSRDDLAGDRKSTRLNSSHVSISYAV